MKKIVLFTEDKVGVLADITYVFSQMKIGIETITASVIDNKGVICITVKNNEEKALEVLKKNGYEPRITEAQLVRLKNNPEILSKFMAEFKKANISINSIHQLASDKENLLLEITTKNPLKAKRVTEKFLEKYDKDYELRKKFDQI